MGKIVLVTGGARSGKSRFAEQYARNLGDKLAYIATAQVLDEEMADRVKLHQGRRSENWHTFEAAFAAEQAIQAAADFPVVLFDCLTIYTANLLLAEQSTDIEARRESVLQQADLVIKAAQASKSTIIFVANEVGMGIVPDNALSREYRDLAGWINQKVAAVSDEVHLVVCGLAVELKKLAQPVQL
ncbi:bifunctional adenosylcobinamide kinase/adenosylcobinamide-phosphate guanylyltransferase [Anaerosporomusa subterranea]|uniref:Adenosylcobinamide kinase n=1 Tax=Anaerosporomusa subterranea TaxID=1794912 RepID=A0A154BT38_ANASB|nr:bifunctional adenosylcobinamide kinase/adenosylcobinamide-phosphate guanylyltransferase [Anaerosporomusa subterranea]KYZ77089.1 bifunctional adenosylcobinamide kinase/adenosylcobinamide-phosphate guanylyltransferase [Anaerosporomusa subterranea]